MPAAPVYADVRSHPCTLLKCKPHEYIHIENAVYKYHYHCSQMSYSFKTSNVDEDWIINLKGQSNGDLTCMAVEVNP